MEDREELHPAVELLLARMKSNPEEFSWMYERWKYIVEQVKQYCSPTELEVLEKEIRVIRLAEAHEWIMADLLKGADE